MKVLLIAPYKGLAALIESMESELEEFSVRTHVADLDKSIKLLDRYKLTGEQFDVIISRGGTAEVLKLNTTIPVIDIHISGYDILRMLTLLKSYNTRIGMVGFKQIIYSFEAVSSVINLDIDYRVVKDESDVMETLVVMKKQGIHIVVGDAVTIKKATTLGMQGVLITSGKESVLDAFQKAKQLKQEVQKYSRQAELFESLFNRLHHPAAILSESGRLQYANRAIKKQMTMSALESNLFKEMPNMAMAFQEEYMSDQINYFVSGSTFKQPSKMNIGKLSDSTLEVYYYMELEPGGKLNENEFDIIFCDPQVEAIPQLIASEESYREAVNLIGENDKWFSITGERGTGKRMIIRMIWEFERFRNGMITEVRFNSPSTATFNKVIKMLESSREGDVIHLCYLENLTISQQKKLNDLLERSDAFFVFSTVGDKEMVLETADKLLKELSEKVLFNHIHLAPIRERIDELGGYIRTFILYFNEIYGKQVIGLTEQAMNGMMYYPWHGNMIELRKAVGQLVKTSKDVYITEVEQVISDMKKDQFYGKSSYVPVNFSQPLEAIQMDILKEVYEQENKNQSRTAARLGINRSTLWRKLKEDPRI